MFKKIGVGVLTLLGLAILAVFFFAKDVDVKLSEAQANEAILKQIHAGPISSRGVKLTINAASVDFNANNTAALNVDFIADGFGYSGNMRGDFGTGIRYEAPRIYLANVVPVEMELIMDSETEGKVQDLKNVATDFLKRQRKEMLSEDAKESLDNIVGRNEVALKEFTTSATYRIFETVPIYDLNNAGIKGSLASLALKDVRFTETEAIITLSPAQALIKILGFIGIALLSFILLFASFMPRRDKIES